MESDDNTEELQLFKSVFIKTEEGTRPIAGAVKTEGNDHELIEILSSPEGSPEKKRFRVGSGWVPAGSGWVPGGSSRFRLIDTDTRINQADKNLHTLMKELNATMSVKLKEADTRLHNKDNNLQSILNELNTTVSLKIYTGRYRPTRERENLVEAVDDCFENIEVVKFVVVHLANYDKVPVTDLFP
ncbi:hypothetical protein P5673_025153 [Acropora cervicornis]|uniref:Uncharacterized protein n=1 Tax=Acropora cervicornis TaxID=6130 RepID=A0AAD9Q2C4_ACRCE|nr:hypothetical protein P5673_025153 [Acropora cervicornis]